MVEIDLKGRKAFVTGGSRGIGAGICRVLAACGADIAFSYKSNSTAADALEEDLNKQGIKALAIKAAATSAEEMTSAITTAEAFLGGLDILAVNVGQNRVAGIEELSIEDWREGIEINLTTAYIAVKLAYPFLKKSPRSDIILIGSSGVYDGGGGTPFYAAAKTGLVGLMYNLMREVPKFNMHINTIHPCVVDTDLLRGRYNTPEKIAGLEAQVPLGRLSTPEDIGNLAAFLCSDLGSFITGQSILVDGGRTIWKK